MKRDGFFFYFSKLLSSFHSNVGIRYTCDCPCCPFWVSFEPLDEDSCSFIHLPAAVERFSFPFQVLKGIESFVIMFAFHLLSLFVVVVI